MIQHELVQQHSSMMEGHQMQMQGLGEMGGNTSESEMGRLREDELDTATKSGSENQDGGFSGDDQDQQRPKKKRYHRHTQHQIQEMEA